MGRPHKRGLEPPALSGPGGRAGAGTVRVGEGYGSAGRGKGEYIYIYICTYVYIYIYMLENGNIHICARAFNSGTPTTEPEILPGRTLPSRAKTNSEKLNILRSI